MRKTTNSKRWVSWAAGIVTFALAMTAASAGSVRLDPRPATPLVMAGAQQTVYLRVALDGLDPMPGNRAPVNVAIVLDRSGSMRGHKIAEAKRAALMALDRLHDDDIVSVITYESTVRVLVPATKLRDRAAVRQAIQSIETGDRTALYAGVVKGTVEIRKFITENRVNLMILLSDGLANVGPNSPGELAQLGTSLKREGIAVTTIGLGLDYNEDLMTRLAYVSDGNHFFVENAAELAAAYASEFGDALSVVARDVKIWIRCYGGARPVRVLGPEAEISGRDVHVTMNQLFRDQTRYLILEVEVPAGYVGQHRRLADVDLRYVDLGDGSKVHMKDRASIEFTDSNVLVERSIDREVMASVASQLGVERAETAMLLRDAGKIEDSRAMFERNSALLREQAQQLDDDSLLEDSILNLGFSKELDEENWERSRKEQQEYQFKVHQSRARDFIPKKGKDEGGKKD